MSDWQPIETAPKDGSAILLWPGAKIWTDQMTPAIGWYARGFGWTCSSAGASGDIATHWMPLPEPPRVEA
jgi:hypothetical protein